jgi:hypothetical protein
MINAPMYKDYAFEKLSESDIIKLINKNYYKKTLIPFLEGLQSRGISFSDNIVKELQYILDNNFSDLELEDYLNSLGLTINEFSVNKCDVNILETSLNDPFFEKRKAYFMLGFDKYIKPYFDNSLTSDNIQQFRSGNNFIIYTLIKFFSIWEPILNEKGYSLFNESFLIYVINHEHYTLINLLELYLQYNMPIPNLNESTIQEFKNKETEKNIDEFFKRFEVNRDLPVVKEYIRLKTNPLINLGRLSKLNRDNTINMLQDMYKFITHDQRYLIAFSNRLRYSSKSLQQEMHYMFEEVSKIDKLLIIGINEMRMWIKNDMKILVFSDTHTLEYKCDEEGIDVATFIEKLKNNTKNTIDVFAEINYLRKGIFEEKSEDRNSFLSETSKRFSKHTSIDKSAVINDNLRFHYGDMREMFRKKYNIQEFNDCVVNLYYHGIICSNIEKYLQQFPDSNAILKLARDSLNDPKLIKQKQKIDKKVLREIEYSTELTLQNIRYVNYESIIRDFIARKKYKKNKNYIKEKSYDIFKSMVSSMAVAGDAYVMARLFSNTLNIKRAILYFGGAHNDRYENILKGLGFKMIVNFETSEKFVVNDDLHKPQCLDISSFNIRDFLD